MAATLAKLSLEVSWHVDQCSGSADGDDLTCFEACSKPIQACADRDVSSNSRVVKEHRELRVVLSDYNDKFRSNGAGWTDFYGDAGSGGPLPVRRGGAEDKKSMQRSSAPTLSGEECVLASFTDFYGYADEDSPSTLSSPTGSSNTSTNLACDDFRCITDVGGDTVDDHSRASSSTDTPCVDCMRSTSLFEDAPRSLSRGASSDDEVPRAMETEGKNLTPSADEWKNALAMAMRCNELEDRCLINEAKSSVWEQTMLLFPMMSFVALRQPRPQSGLLSALRICKESLLQVSEGCFTEIERLSELLDSEELGSHLNYLEELEVVLRKVSPSCCSELGRVRSRLDLESGVESALTSWQQDYDSLYGRVCALRCCIMDLGPTYQSHCLEWQRASEVRKAVQVEQEEAYLQISRDLDAAIHRFSTQVQDSCSEEMLDFMGTTSDALGDMFKFTGDTLEQHQKAYDTCYRDYEQAGADMEVVQVALKELRHQVSREAEALHDEVVIFCSQVEHVFSWRGVLVEQVHLLKRCRSEVQLVMQLRRQLQVLGTERIACEDEFDTAQIELRKHRRHAQRFSQCCSTHDASEATPDAVHCKHEHRVVEAGQQLQALTVQIGHERGRLREVEAELPLTLIQVEEFEPNGANDCPDQWGFWPEGRLAWKLAELEQKHREVELRASIVQAERDEALRKVAKIHDKHLAEFPAESDLMCPITHERMKEPVLAADAHTYERAAIEKWMQSHNTSPMTGAALAHRYLTQNFALRRIIESYEAHIEQIDCASSDAGSVTSLANSGSD